MFCFTSPSPTLLDNSSSVLRFWKRIRKVILRPRLLSTYGQRHLSDFDKYTALSMAESLASDARQVNHSKASFLAVASQTLRSHLQKSSKVFQAYFLALFADKEYTQILDRISKVDKSFRSDPASRASNAPQDLLGTSGREFMRSQRLICFYCGIAGHTANRCYLRSPEPASTFCQSLHSIFRARPWH